MVRCRFLAKYGLMLTDATQKQPVCLLRIYVGTMSQLRGYKLQTTYIDNVGYDDLRHTVPWQDINNEIYIRMHCFVTSR